MAEINASERQGPGYLLFTLILSILGLLLVGISALPQLDPAVITILQYADFAVCVVFFLDFLFTLGRTRQRKRYLVTWGWLDLVSSIPMLPALRLARMGRVIRVIRVLRSMRSLRILIAFILERRAQSTMMAAVLLSILLLLVGSMTILQLEQGPDVNIHGPEDALWWSMVTFTTVGYGDRYPVTPEGRVLAVLLMVAGVGLFGVLSGFVAAWFLSPTGKEGESEIASLRKEILELRALLQRGDRRISP